MMRMHLNYEERIRRLIIMTALLQVRGKSQGQYANLEMKRYLRY